MITPKENVLDRFEQSFQLLFSSLGNFKKIFLPYFFYKFIIVIVLGNLFYFTFINFFDFSKLVTADDFSGVISDLFGSTQFIIGVNLFLIFILINLILVIPFILGTIKTIKEIYEGNKNINLIENIKYGFINLGNSFNIYWYMFAYVALLPLLILIIGGLLFIGGKYTNLDVLSIIGLYIAGFGMFFFIIFSIYRGLKTTFSIIYAVDKNNYNKSNFIDSIKITDNNWWRIAGNLLLVGIILSLIFSIINSIISLFKFSISDFNYMGLLELTNGNLNQEKINNLISSFTTDIGVFSFKSFLFEIIDLILETLRIIFIFIFTYIFFKRLEIESGIKVDYKQKIDDGEVNKNFEL